MQEGIEFARVDTEQATEEHEPLTARDLAVLNEGLRREDVVILRNVATFVANARRQGLRVGYENQALLCVRFDVEGCPDQIQSAFEEAIERDLGAGKILPLGKRGNYFSVDT